MGAQRDRQHLKALQGGNTGVCCDYPRCGAKPGEIHSAECKEAWRKKILSYKS